MTISGPFHKFRYLPADDAGHGYLSDLGNKDEPKLADDVLMEIFPSIADIDSYNPSTRLPFKGINTTGPTVLSGNGLKSLLAALEDIIQKVSSGSEIQEYGTESFERESLKQHLKKVRDFIAEAIHNEKKVLHLGV